jgi:DNA polymerase III subunit epsilon
MKLKLTKPLAFIDLETTGLNIASDRIVEIAIIKVNPDQQIQKMTMLVNPGVSIPEKVTAIHGIKDSDVEDKPLFDKVAKEIVNFIGNSDLSGYNILKFDLPLLVEEFLRAGVDFELENRRVIDVQQIFHKMEKRDLAAAYKFYCGKEIKNQHSAEADIDATLSVFNAQLEKYPEISSDISGIYEFLGKPLEQSVDLASRIIMDDNQCEIYNFGKYKGQKVDDIFEKDPSYFNWIQKSDFPLYTKKKLTELIFKWKNKRK